MYTLYYSPGSCSRAVHCLLEEIGAPYQAQKVENKQAPEFLAVNPRGQVPVLKDGDLVIVEGVAIMNYLFEKNPNSTLMPKNQPDRARAMQWLCYLNSSLHPIYSRVFGAKTISSDEKVIAEICKSSDAKIQKAWDDIEQHLGKNKFLAGDQMSVADVLMSVIYNWRNAAKLSTNYGPNTQRVVDAVCAQPWFGAVKAREEQAKAA